MGYPWGPENWPTIERMEPAADELANDYYAILDTLTEQATRRKTEEARRRPIVINLTPAEDTDVEQAVEDAWGTAVELADEDVMPDTGETIDLMGMAFARALAMQGLDDPDSDLRRFFQDLFDVLENGVIGRADTHDES